MEMELFNTPFPVSFKWVSDKLIIREKTSGFRSFVWIQLDR